MFNDFIEILKKTVFIAVFLSLSFTFAIFILQNTHEVRVYFDLLKIQDIPSIKLSIWALVFSCVGIGILIGMVLMWVYEADLRKNFEDTKEKQDRLEKDMSKLKTNISKTIS